MKYQKLDPFGVKIQDLDLRTASDQELREIPNLVAEHLVVVIKNQTQLSINQFDSINRLWGRHEITDLWCRHPESKITMQVTNKNVDENQKQGLFPDGEMRWHVNGPFMPDPEQVLVLWSQIPGQNSTTSFLDCATYFDELPEELKKSLLRLKVKLTNVVEDTILGKPVCRVDDLSALIELEKHRTRQLTNKENDFQKWEDRPLFEVTKSLVVEHPISLRKGLYFPFNYASGFDGLDDTQEEHTLFSTLYDRLVNNPKYIYDHHWAKGDLVLSDQILTQHKRNEHHGIRELFRTVFWYHTQSNL